MWLLRVFFVCSEYGRWLLGYSGLLLPGKNTHPQGFNVNKRDVFFSNRKFDHLSCFSKSWREVLIRGNKFLASVHDIFLCACHVGVH